MIFELIRVSFSESIHTFKGVEVQRPMCLFEQIKEIWQVHGKILQWNQCSSSPTATSIVQSYQGKTFKSSIPGEFVSKSLLVNLKDLVNLRRC